MMHMFSLALTPTYTIGLNKDFRYPKGFEIQCNSRPSVFSYPKKMEEKKVVDKKRVETVALSTTAKNKARLARKKAKEDGHNSSSMDVDESDKPKDEDEKKDGDDMDVDGDEPEKKLKKKREPEPNYFRVKNPARITSFQSVMCAFDLDQRYRPIRPEEKPYGVIILTDSTPGEVEELGAVKAPSLEPEGELPAPEPFEWMPPSVPATDEGNEKND
jgi:26S proteasome regulatory subunit N2